MPEFLAGVVVALCAVAALHFFRFMRQAKDRLFGYFAVAFALLGVNYLMLAFSSPQSERHPYLYLVRLAAFVIILVAIVDKNRKAGPHRPPEPGRSAGDQRHPSDHR